MSLGDKDAFEGEGFPAMIHFITELKKEKKSQSWEKLEGFAQKAKENLKLLEETQQIKMHDKRIDRSFIGVLPKNTEEAIQLFEVRFEFITEIDGKKNL